MYATHWPDLAQIENQYDGDKIVPWESSESLNWLNRTPANKSFVKLSRYYEAQADKFMCGPATIAIVLNCLKMGSRQFLPFDADQEKFPRQMNLDLPAEYRTSFQRYTQKNIFLNCSHVKPINDVYGAKPGLTLNEIEEIFKAHQVRTQIHHASSNTFRTDFATITKALSTEGHYVVANFDRSLLGMKGGGHISPVAALDLASQKALIMDVNMCGQWLWIDLTLLLESMSGHDGEKARGFLIVSSAAETKTTF